MDKFKLKMQNFMNGRNGPDKLGKDIGIFSIIIYVIALFIGNQILYTLSLIGMMYSLFRIFSKNLSARRSENQSYNQYIRKYHSRLEMHKDYRIFKCKGCGKKIRVPRGKGKVEITCPMCGKKIIRHT